MKRTAHGRQAPRKTKPKDLLTILGKLAQTYDDLEDALDNPASTIAGMAFPMQQEMRNAVTELLDHLDTANASARLRLLLGDAAIPDDPSELYEKPK